MQRKKVLITGVGGVGVFAAHLIAKLPEVDLYLGRRGYDFIKHKANGIMDSAYYMNPENPYPTVVPVQMDLMDLEKTTEQLKEIQPDVILHLATLLAAQKIREGLPVDVAKKIYDANPVGTGLRPWAPGHTVLLLNLMKAVKASGIDTKVVNGSGCDFLHLSFSKFGLAPTCGLGDFALLEPGIKRILARTKGYDQTKLELYMTGHHSLVMPIMFFGDSQGIPYKIRTVYNGEDISDSIDYVKEVFPHLPDESSWPPNAASTDQEQTAAHAARIVKAIVYDTNEILNVPAPQGQPGCYPARVGADGAKIVLSEGETLEDLVEINVDGNIAEGFKEIQDDGTMVATDRTIELVEEIFGIDWKYKSFHPEEAFEAYKEIQEAYNNFAKKYK